MHSKGKASLTLACSSCEFGLFQNLQVAVALSRIKHVMASVKLILILHPSGGEENVKNLSLLQVKNLACGFGSPSCYRLVSMV